MYSYTVDKETGGLLLNSTPTNFSKEPRPVYAQEMDLLGFADYWRYEAQNETPYLWAESNTYWYRGEPIAKIKGGDLYHAPVLTPILDESGEVVFGKTRGEILRPIDLKGMCKKNEALLSIIEGTTVKLIVKEYEKFKNKLDIFHVAFSGGKDSAVLLDLVKKALPAGSFVVIFGDTGMEFPDTYEVVKRTQAICEKDGTPFYIARSHFKPEDSWKMFGPPARLLRWCCSVHKSTPQTLTMRELTGKDNYTGMDFVGVRRHESLARSKYDYENFGKKQKGQYSYNPILEWTSAEVWAYIYANNIPINATYKKGNSRAGCLMCPMSGGCSDYIRRQNYRDEIDVYINMVKESNAWDSTAGDIETYLTSGGWISRRSGRGIKGNALKYKESTIDGVIQIEIVTDNADWLEWIKTVDIEPSEYSYKRTETGWLFSVDEKIFKQNPSKGKLFRQALRKAAYCVGCRVCETNCKLGRLKFNESGHVSITNCAQCHECHDIPGGCHVYNSLKIPQGERKMKTINCFDDHAPKRDWLVAYFDLKDEFFEGNSLGPNMLTHFKRFLRDAELINNNSCTDFTYLIDKLGWETETALALMLVNLVNTNAQFEWYVLHMDVGVYYDIKALKDVLMTYDMKEKAANCIIKAFKRIVDTPFGSVLNFGYCSPTDMVRTKCIVTDNRVILYALYKFIEKCNLGNDIEFHLSYLFDDEVERDGISPVRMFGIYEEEEWKSILLGLSARYPEFINATFTNDLKTISLKGKTSAEVLELFEEDL